MTKNPAPLPPFRHRGHEVSRLEAFSDIVFGFALTILVVSLEAPKTATDLFQVMRNVVPFAFCFFVFLQIWYEHHRFFRRYALQDVRTHAINAMLLFTILVYVYPLKFLASVWLGAVAQDIGSVLSVHDVPSLFAIYGLGLAAIYGLIAALYGNAYRQRATLDLDPVEVFDTKHSIVDNGGMMAIALLSVITAQILPLRLVGLAGYMYSLIGVWKWWLGSTAADRRRTVARSAAAPA